MELQHGQAHRQHDKSHGNGHTLTSGVKKLLYPVEEPAHQAAQTQGQNDLHDRLHYHSKHADMAVCQSRGDAIGHGEQHQTHRVIDGHHQKQKLCHGAVRLILSDHHQSCGRRRGCGNGAQGDGTGNGENGREKEVQHHQHDVHHNGGDHGLQNANGNGLRAGSPKLAQAELIANGKGDEAQGRLGDNF